MNPYQSSLLTASNDTVHDSLEWFPSFCWAFVLFALPSLASRVCIPLGYVGIDNAFRFSSTVWQLGSFGSILIAAIAFAWFANRITFRSHLRCLCGLIATTCVAFGPIVLYHGKLPSENALLMITVFTVLSQSAICACLTQMSASRVIRFVFLALIPYGLGCATGTIDVIVVALATSSLWYPSDSVSCEVEVEVNKKWLGKKSMQTAMLLYHLFALTFFCPYSLALYSPPGNLRRNPGLAKLP